LMQAWTIIGLTSDREAQSSRAARHGKELGRVFPDSASLPCLPSVAFE
jgi:hypothetical protein